LISAKRNKEGVVEISGLIDNRQYFISVDGNVLYVSDVEGCKIVKIEDEKESEPKFIPTHEELLEWGFEPFKTSTIALSKKHFYDYYQKISPNKFYMQYYPYDNSLMEFGGKTKTFPFTTKQDFMRIVGYDETFGDKLSDIDLKLCELKSQMMTMLSDAKIELTKKLFSRES